MVTQGCTATAENFEVYQGENRQVTFRVTLNGRAVDMSAGGFIMSLVVKKHLDDIAPVFAKLDDDFNKLYSDLGVVSVMLTEADTATPGAYKGQFRVRFPNGLVRKSKVFDLEILESVDATRLLATSMAGVSSTSGVDLDIS